ncbi:ATP-grasp domain-containing protein [Kitasatospora sp. NPDC001683]
MAGEAHPPKLLLVGGARAMTVSVDMALHALDQAASRGIRIHTVNHADVIAATPEVNARTDETSVVDFTSPEATVDWALGKAAEGERFDAVYALQEMAQVTSAETAAALGLPGNPPAAIRQARTKDACRAALGAAGFVQPAVRLCADLADAQAFLRESTGPWIVKPRDAMGSIGVSQVSGIAELPAAMRLLPTTEPFLVEEFVDGPEFSVEGVFLGGKPTVLGITEKETVPPPYFVEVGHVLPAPLPEHDQREIVHQVTSALTTLGLRTGAFHVELWLSERGVVLGEVHGRVGGDWIHRMLGHAVPGLELYGLIFDDLLDRPQNHGPLEATRGAAVRYLSPPPGRLVAVEGWAEVAAHPAVLHAELHAEPGDSIRPLHRSSDRIGLVVVGADTAEQARRLARELCDSVRFTVVPEEEHDGPAA